MIEYIPKDLYNFINQYIILYSSFRTIKKELKIKAEITSSINKNAVGKCSVKNNKNNYNLDKYVDISSLGEKFFKPIEDSISDPFYGEVNREILEEIISSQLSGYRNKTTDRMNVEKQREFKVNLLYRLLGEGLTKTYSRYYQDIFYN